VEEVELPALVMVVVVVVVVEELDLVEEVGVDGVEEEPEAEAGVAYHETCVAVATSTGHPLLTQKCVVAEPVGS
jgi:hypothetical protein